jgi:DNA-binding response OmpR family regulator
LNLYLPENKFLGDPYEAKGTTISSFCYCAWYEAHANSKNVTMTKILVVDDNADLLMMLRQTMKEHGYEVTTLADAEHLFETIDQLCPSLIILDINIGEVDGRQLCREIRSRSAYDGIKIVLFSADPGYGSSANNCGAEAYIFKPLSTAYMLSKIKEILEGTHVPPEDV